MRDHVGFIVLVIGVFRKVNADLGYNFASSSEIIHRYFRIINKRYLIIQE